VDITMAQNLTATRIVAHHSTLKDGERLRKSQYKMSRRDPGGAWSQFTSLMKPRALA
jgi:hypothetical protein